MRLFHFIPHALLVLIAGLFLFSCTTTPTNPYDISNTKIFLVARSSTQPAGNHGIADSVGNPITAGFSSNFPSNLDSVRLELVLANGNDSLLKTFTGFDSLKSSDTLWKTIFFTDSGTKTIKGTAYIKGYDKPYSDSISIRIYAKPLNHAPVVIVNGKSSLSPGETCILTLSINDSDQSQKDSISIVKAPSGYGLNGGIFTWTPPTGFAGLDTVIFIVSDNGYPRMFDTATVIISVTGITINHAPKWQDKTLNEVISPGNAINLTLSSMCKDTDNDPLTFSLLAGVPSNDSITNVSTSPTYTFMPGQGDTGVFYPRIVAKDPGGLADTMTIHLTIKTTPITDTAKVLTAFSFASPAVTGTITESTKTVALTVPSGTDVTALVATFVSTGASVKVGTAVQTSGTTPNNFTSPVTYTVVAADGSTQAYVVMVTVSANTAKALTSFSFATPAVIGTITESSKTVAITVPSGTDVTALVATFVSTGASVKVGTVVQTSGTTPNNFTSPVTYTVVAADGSTQAYVVTVTVSANTAKALTAFSFSSPAVTGTITESSKTVAITVPSGTDVTALVATFVSTGASVKVGTAVQTSGTTPNNFTNPVTYTIVAGDGSTQAYMVTVTVSANTAKALTSFSFASPVANGSITESAKTVALTVPFGTDVTALVATFVSTGASVKVGTVVQTSGTTPNNFTSPVTYTVVAADGSTQAYVVTVTVAANTAKALTSFSFTSPAVSGTITESSKTVALTVPFGTEVTALKATFVSTGASVKVGTVVQASGTTPNNFTNPVTYTVIAEDGGTQAYVVTVTIGANTAIIIATQPQDQTKCIGSPVSFSVTASTAVGTLSYQWKNVAGNLTGGHFTGTTTNSLSISAVATGDTGTYSCLVTSTGGGSPVTSAGAKLAITMYTVKFNGKGGSAVDSQIVTCNSTATTPATPPTKTGYTFTGWCSDTGTTTAFNFSTPITASITLYAKWTATSYTITYNLNGGTNNSSNPATYTIASTAITLADPSYTGYTFGGWFTNAGLTGTAVTSIPAGSTGNQVFWAKWTAISYTITYNLNSGTNNSSNPATYTIASTAITLADPSYTGYTFGGWFTNVGLTGTAITSIPAGSTGNQVFWAKWTATTYTITYNLNGGTNGSNPSTYTIASATITLANPTYTGYTFGGWFTNVGLTGTAVTSIPTGSTGNQAFWAKWTAIPYTVTFNSQGAIDPAAITVTAPAITVGTLPTPPTKLAYIFDGWWTSPNGAGSAFTASTPVSANITVYAKWVVKDYDGNIYTTVTIGSQVWLVENLKTTHLNDGTPIPQVTDAGTWNGLFAMGYCWYNNNSATSYGAIYNFYTVWTQKLAPTGWHVPSDNEWYTLWGSVDVGTLKEKGLAHWSDSTGATNSTGFTALPGGERYFVDGSFDGMGSTAYFWSSSQTTITGVAWGIHFESYSSSYQDVMKNGFSVRCIRDY